MKDKKISWGKALIYLCTTLTAAFCKGSMKTDSRGTRHK